MNCIADIRGFPDEVAEKIGNYVYRLIDPRSGETFYVGKGKGNRVFDHARAAIRCNEEEVGLEPKLERIREILNEGLEILHVIHRHEIPDAAVLEVEAALIDAYPGLTNQQSGHGSNAKGPVDVRQLIDKYARPELDHDIKEGLILINVNASQNLFDRHAIYEQVRFAWRISPKRALNADYVLAVVRGVVIGAFVADEWLEANSANFPGVPHAKSDANGRFAFNGRVAPDGVWERFVGVRGKRVSREEMKHDQNPIRYWNA
jgi:uncharacterized protein